MFVYWLVAPSLLQSSPKNTTANHTDGNHLERKDINCNSFSWQAVALAVPEDKVFGHLQSSCSSQWYQARHKTFEDCSLSVLGISTSLMSLAWAMPSKINFKRGQFIWEEIHMCFKSKIYYIIDETYTWQSFTLNDEWNHYFLWFLCTIIILLKRQFKKDQCNRQIFCTKIQKFKSF